MARQPTSGKNKKLQVRRSGGASLSRGLRRASPAQLELELELEGNIYFSALFVLLIRERPRRGPFEGTQ